MGDPHIPSFPPSPYQAIDNLESRFARIPELANVKASNPPAQAQAQASTEPATQAGSWGLPRQQCLGSRVPPVPAHTRLPDNAASPAPQQKAHRLALQLEQAQARELVQEPTLKLPHRLLQHQHQQQQHQRRLPSPRNQLE